MKKKIVTKLKIANCDKNEKLRFLQNSKAQIITTLKNLKNVNTIKQSNCGKIQRPKL